MPPRAQLRRPNGRAVSFHARRTPYNAPSATCRLPIGALSPLRTFNSAALALDIGAFARRQLPGESKRPSRWPKPRDRFPRNASRGQLRPCDRSPSIASSHGLSAALPSRANPEAGATRSAACRTPRHSAASKHSIVSPRRCWCLLLARFRQRRVSHGLAIGANQVSRDRHEHTGIERIAAPLACAATALRPRQSGGMTTSGRSRRGSRFRSGRLPTQR